MTETKRPVSEGAEELIGKYFPVLDYGFISLKDYCGTDKCIDEAARVSYSASSTRKVNETEGLLRYLRRHVHSTPFEMVQLKFHISMPIFVMRQWIRHRMSSTNEFSGRYSLMPMVFYTPKAENFQKQSKSNNQGRVDLIEHDKYRVAVERWNELRFSASHLYEDLLEEDVARELARIDLPTSTYTQCYWSIDLHNLFRFLTLRTDSHAQWEIQQFANTMAGIVKLVAPYSFKAWEDYERGGTNLSRMEMNALLDYVYHKRDIHHAMDMTEFEKSYGFSRRESTEFFEKLKPKEMPNFDLDLSTAMPGEFYEQLLNSKVPQVDKK